MMTRLLFIALTVLIFLGCWFLIKNATDSYKILPIAQSDMNSSESGVESWREFEAAEKKFRVLLPKLPQQVKQNFHDPRTKEVRNYDMYLAEKSDGTVFMISIITFPKIENEEEGKNLMTQVMDDMLSSQPENKLVEMTPGQYKGRQSLDFRLKNPKMDIQTKEFVANNVLYVLSVLAKHDGYHEADFHYFINSFELNNAKD